MKNKQVSIKSKIIVFVLLSSLFMVIIPFNDNKSVMQASTGIYTEDFTSTTYMDDSSTNVTGWGTGSIENSKKKPTIVGSISSALIGETIDVFVEGDFAYITNQDQGLKVVNITDITNPFINGTYITYNVAEGVYIDGNYAFIADYEGDPTQKNFIVLDISNPTNPYHLGDCSTFEVGNEAAWDVVASGDVAYVANGEGGLCVVDISNPSSPDDISHRDTPGFSYELEINGDYAYVADGTNGLVVIDISNPLLPKIKATYNQGISSAIDVIVEGNIAYIVDIYDGIVVVNITDPTTPSYAGSWSKTGVSDAYVYGDFLYITDINDGLSVTNITDPNTPILINSLSLPGTAHSIVIDGIYAYITCQDTTPSANDGGLQIVQIADPTAPTHTYSSNALGDAVDVSISGDYAYLAQKYGTGLSVFDISDPASPVAVGSCPTLSTVWAVYVSGDYAYLAVNDRLQIINITDPYNPYSVGQYLTPDRPYDVCVKGDCAFVADGSTLEILNVTDPSSPTFVGSIETLIFSYVDGVQVKGDYAYIADGGRGLLVVDISNPSSPTAVGSYDTPGTARGIFVSGDFAYIADEDGGLQIIDISSPFSPTFVTSYATPGIAFRLFVSGNYAYIADEASGLQIVDISDPYHPENASAYNPVDYVYGVSVAGDHAYIAIQNNGLLVLRVRNNKARQFVTPSSAQSTIVYSSSSITINKATLNPTDSQPPDTSIIYELSADGGANWESVSPGVEHVFSIPGNQLKWRATLASSNILITPMINNLSITYCTTLITPSLDTPIDNYITEDYTPTFIWTGIDDESFYLFQIDNTISFTNPLLNITIPSSSTSYTPVSPLIAGTYYWRVAGIDSEGDIGEFSNYRTLYVIADANPPTITNPSDVSYEQGATGNIITWSPTDSNPYWYNITLNGILTSYDDPWTGGDIVMNIDGLPLGVHTVICYVYDLEGLMNSDTVEVEVVTTAPPFIDDIADFAYEEGTTGNSITWHPSDANPDYYSVTRDGIILEESPWLGGDITIDIDGLAYGFYTFVCYVNDTEGQSNSDTVIVTVTDNIAPILNTPLDVIYDEGDTGNTIIWIATDNNPATYIIYRDGTQVDDDSWISGSSIVISVDGLSAASYNYTIVVLDQAGNSAKDEVTVAVTPTVTEFNHNFYWIFISTAIICAILYISPRKQKKT